MTQQSDGLGPHAGEKESGRIQDRQATPSAAGAPESEVKDATSPASKPHGTLRNQVETMEGEGQAQPQADELPPEERAKTGPAAGNGDKLSGDQKKMAQDGTGF